MQLPQIFRTGGGGGEDDQIWQMFEDDDDEMEDAEGFDSASITSLDESGSEPCENPHSPGQSSEQSPLQSLPESSDHKGKGKGERSRENQRRADGGKARGKGGKGKSKGRVRMWRPVQSGDQN